MTRHERIIIRRAIKGMIAGYGLKEQSQIGYITNGSTLLVNELDDYSLVVAMAYLSDLRRCEPIRIELLELLKDIEEVILDFDGVHKCVSQGKLMTFLGKNGFPDEYSILTYEELLEFKNLVVQKREKAFHKTSLSATKSLLKELSIPVIATSRTPRKKRNNEKSNNGTTK